jgi:hypothetical protein
LPEDKCTDALAGSVETREITVQRTFANFQEFWSTSVLAASIRWIMSRPGAKDCWQAGELERAFAFSADVRPVALGDRRRFFRSGAARRTQRADFLAVARLPTGEAGGEA